MEGDFRVDQWLVQPQLNTVVSPDNKTVQLEPKVMEVLVYLADHAGEVVSKESLLQALWGDAFVTENALTRCIAELRRVTEDDAREPRFIQTIAKKGYRLIARVSNLKGPASRYEIVEKLGQGAMGEVFLAKDTELQRKVAMKFVLGEGGEEEAARRRLLREARAAAALDHPYITKIYDTGELEGKTFIAMEYVQGQTLKQKLSKGRLEMKEALRIALEIAEALEAAHERGIVHRDLKPSNIMITPQGHVKVMDFGLAKRLPQPDQSASLEETVSALTKEGTTAGTLPYMSPEQLRAETVDSRSDLFSFGIVLYEMLTGVHPFQKSNAIETASAILQDAPPPLADKVPGTQPLLQHVLDKLLAKDLDRRYQIIHDARTDLAEAMDSPPRRAVPSIEGIAPARTGLRTIMSAAMLVLASVAITVAVMRILQETPSLVPPASLVRAVIKLEPGLKLAALPTREEADYGYDRPSRTAMAISPDGRYLVYSAIGTVSPEREPDELGPRERAEQAGQPQLYLRALSEADARPIAGTDGGVCPFFSPDGQWIGFRTDAELRKVSVAGGPPVNICELPLRGWGPGHNVLGASWGSGETIAFAHVDGGLWKVPSSGGKPEVLTSLDPSRNERTHRLPFLLPDGKAVIFTVMDSTRSSSPRIELQSLTSGERKVLIENGADARYAPSGHLVYARKGVMMAAPFDARRLEVTGAPVSVGQVMQALVYPTYQSLNTGAAQFSFSTSGSLVYVPGDVYPTPVRDLIWVDRQGKEQVVESLDQFVSAPRISPDGLFVAYHAINANGHHQIWLYDLPRKNRIQFSFEGDASQPMWTPDAKRLVFAFSDAPNRPNNIYWQAADRSSPMERLTSSEYPRVAGSWSRDGRYLAFTETHPSTKVDICVLQMEDRKVVEAVKSPADDVTPAFSPDGRFLAYASLESGDLEVYVQPFPGPGARNKISTGGGREPVWSPDGRELFYRDPSERRVMVVDIRTEPAFSAGTPRTLFEGPNPYFAATPQQYDVAPNGRRFLMLRRRQHVETITEMILVHNWFEELKRLVPAGR